jgi:hypothetical protein
MPSGTAARCQRPILNLVNGFCSQWYSAGEQKASYNMSYKIRKPIKIAEWPRGCNGQVIRITLKSFKGHNVIDIRTWWMDQNGKVRATRKGLTVGISHTPKLAKGLRKAVRKLEKRGLLDEE